MSTPNSPSQLEALNIEIDRGMRAARTGTILTTILALVSILLVGYWLTYANRKFMEQATPETAIGVLASKIQTSAPEYGPQLSRWAIDSAPRALDAVESQLNEVPDRLAKQLTERSQAEVGRLMPQAEEQMYKALKDALDNARAQRGTMKDDEVAKSIVSALGQTYGDESMKLLDQVQGQYISTSGDILTYLQKLADDKDLTHKESLQRQALVTFMTIASRTQKSQG